MKCYGCSDQLSLLRARQRLGLTHQVPGQGQTQVLLGIPVRGTVKGEGGALQEGEDEVWLEKGRADPLMSADSFQAYQLSSN